MSLYVLCVLFFPETVEINTEKFINPEKVINYIDVPSRHKIGVFLHPTFICLKLFFEKKFILSLHAYLIFYFNLPTSENYIICCFVWV